MLSDDQIVAELKKRGRRASPGARSPSTASRWASPPRSTAGARRRSADEPGARRCGRPSSARPARRCLGDHSMVDDRRVPEPRPAAAGPSQRQQARSCSRTSRRSAGGGHRASTRRRSWLRSSSARSWAPPASARASPSRTRGVPGLDRLIGFFARLATPVDYDALDDAPVDLVFLLLAPEDGEHAAAQGAGPDRPPPARSRDLRAGCAREPDAAARPRRCCAGRAPGAGGVTAGAGAARGSIGASTPRPRPGAGAGVLLRGRAGCRQVGAAGAAAGGRRLSGRRRSGAAERRARLLHAARRRRNGLDRAARQRHLPHRHQRAGFR